MRAGQQSSRRHASGSQALESARRNTSAWLGYATAPTGWSRSSSVGDAPTLCADHDHAPEVECRHALALTWRRPDVEVSRRRRRSSSANSPIHDRQASRDDGVDGVAVNENPVVGGLCIIQAKPYSKIVGLEAVHALAGVMDDKQAAKASSSPPHVWQGKQRVRRPQRPHRDHRRTPTQSMLLEHLGLDALISPPCHAPGTEKTSPNQPSPRQPAARCRPCCPGPADSRNLYLCPASYSARYISPHLCSS
jgi:hypothetical protein